MTAKPDAWMPLYVADYLRDTGHLSTEEHGAYLLLLMHAWANSGALPDDDERLRRIARMDAKPWRASRHVLRAFFTAADGTLRHKRVDEEIVRATENQERRTQKARRAADARWGNAQAGRKQPNGDAPSMPGAMLGACPTPSPSPTDVVDDGARAGGRERLSIVPVDDPDLSLVVDFAGRCCEIAGINATVPVRLNEAIACVKDWRALAPPLSNDDVLDAIRAERAKLGTTAVTSIKRFDPAVRAVHAAREAQRHGHERTHRSEGRRGGGGFRDPVLASLAEMAGR